MLGHVKHGSVLIQIKTTSTGILDSEQAIQELEGGRIFYEQGLGVKFSKMLLHTNVTNFSKRTARAAKLYKTDTLGANWVSSALKKNPLSLGDIISRNGSRTSISVR